MTKKMFAMMMLVALGFALVANADFVPAGTEYVAPAGGTLVINEVYGSNNDGQGSWVAAISTAPPTFTVNEESLSININKVQPANFALSYGGTVTVDICLSWTTDTAAWTSHTLRMGDNKSVTFAFSNTAQTLAGLPVPMGKPTVVRFVTTNDYYNVSLINGTSSASASASSVWSSLYAIQLGSHSGSQSAVDFDLNWVKVYTGSTDLSAPLVAVPEPATMGLLAIGGIASLIRRKR